MKKTILALAVVASVGAAYYVNAQSSDMNAESNGEMPSYSREAVMQRKPMGVDAPRPMNGDHMGKFFEEIDTNGDGVISKEEFIAFHNNLIEKRWEEMDVDANGGINKEEFMQRKARMINKAREKMDRINEIRGNNGGTVNMDEFVQQKERMINTAREKMDRINEIRDNMDSAPVETDVPAVEPMFGQPEPVMAPVGEIAPAPQDFSQTPNMFEDVNVSVESVETTNGTTQQELSPTDIGM